MVHTVNSAFQTLLGQLTPLPTEHDLAVSHKDSVFRCLQNSYGCRQFPETGSFGNGTGIRHYSDIDYFAVCPVDKLPSHSDYALVSFREALQRTFPRTEGIRVSNPAVQIPFGRYASERLEVTPARFIQMYQSFSGNNAIYAIPLAGGDWRWSSPGTHNQWVRQVDNGRGGRLKPLIRFVKAWKYYNNVPISSFYLELRVTKFVNDNIGNIEMPTTLRAVMWYLAASQLGPMRDPREISGFVAACSTPAQQAAALTSLNYGLVRATKAVEAGEKDPDAAFNYWNLFFNGNFPGRYY